MTLSNLLYVSIRSPKCSDSDIEKILESSRKNNPGLDITGVLLYTTNRFVQYLEGDYDNISNLYDNIKKDDRHSNVILLSLNKDAGGDRIFPSWAMGGKGIDENEIAFISDLSEDEKKTFQNILNGEEESSEKFIKAIQKVFK